MKTPITYYGGKQSILKHIRPLIPEHNLYCESFAGGAAVFFDKEPAEINVINDLNSKIINFYKVVVTEPDALKKEVLQALHCRNQHQHAWYIYQNPTFFTTVQRAWSVWMLSKMGFAGMIEGTSRFDKTDMRHPKKYRMLNLYSAMSLFSYLRERQSSVMMLLRL